MLINQVSNFPDYFPLSLFGIPVQTPESNAFLAALTAASTSLLFPAEHVAIFLPVYRSSTSNVLPEFDHPIFRQYKFS